MAGLLDALLAIAILGGLGVMTGNAVLLAWPLPKPLVSVAAFLVGALGLLGIYQGSRDRHVAVQFAWGVVVFGFCVGLGVLL